jgi:hypothetical protein
MNIVKTIAPISIEDLKKYFVDKSTFYVIDYKNSTLRGTKLLTYLSNLDIPCDIDYSECSQHDIDALLVDYLNTQMIVNISSLEKSITLLLCDYKDGRISEFAENNKDIIEKWISKLDSLTLYNMSIVSCEQFKEFTNAFLKDDSDSLIGINFISLLKNLEFYAYYDTPIDKNNLKYYNHYFNDYMFKGKNLFSYWANENNPLFLLTYGISEGLLTNVTPVQ